MNIKDNDVFDVIVIGAGPGGVSSSVRLAQLGKNVLCIDEGDKLGGVCLNAGCVPSKFFLHASYQYQIANDTLPDDGLIFNNTGFSVTKMMQKKKHLIDTLSQNILKEYKKQGVNYIKGRAFILDKNTIEIKTDEGRMVVKTDNIIVATGSETVTIPSLEIDEKKIVTSNGLLELEELPKKLLVIGGGIIGVEMSSIYARLGSEVHLIETSKHILSSVDDDIALSVQDDLIKRTNVNIIRMARFIEAQKDKNDKLHVKCLQKIEEEEKEVMINDIDVILVSIGRKPKTKNFGLEGLVNMNQRGHIIVDDCFRTNVENIYGIGDVIPGMMLAHKGADEGFAVAEIICGKRVSSNINYNLIPAIIYTQPEVATVGYSETDLIRKNIQYNIGKSFFSSNARSVILGLPNGFVKILSSKNNSRILGGAIVGFSAGDMITEIGMAIQFGLSVYDLCSITHPHPCLNETIKRAAFKIIRTEERGMKDIYYKNNNSDIIK